MTNYIGHIDNGSNITIITTDKTLTIPADHVAYKEVGQLLKDGNFTAAVEAADINKKVTMYFGKFSEFKFEDGQLFYIGEPMENALTSRVVRMIKEGSDPTTLLNFMANLSENPSARAVSELYRFLESNDLPLTPDGYFLAYKSVNSFYRDRYTGRIDNSVGATVTMPRNKVMDDPNQTCSEGLHFCSLHYLKSMFGAGGHIMILKIHPKDVVSIPVDYNNSKGRCCAYKVIAEHTGGLEEDTLSQAPVYDEDYEDWGYDEDYEW